MQASIGTAAGLKVQHLEVRTETPTDYGLQVRSSKVSMRLDLSETPDLLWKRFPAKLRSQIKRAQQEAMTVRIGRADELDAFYEVFSVNMRDLGTPVYGKSFFASILRELPDSTWICAVYLGDQPVAAGFLMAFRGMLEIPWASSLRRYNRLSPNMLLYWSVLEFACQPGIPGLRFRALEPGQRAVQVQGSVGRRARTALLALLDAQRRPAAEPDAEEPKDADGDPARGAGCPCPSPGSLGRRW